MEEAGASKWKQEGRTQGGRVGHGLRKLCGHPASQSGRGPPRRSSRVVDKA